MAEQERKTKAERREEKRLRRLEEERAAEAAQKKQRVRNIATFVALVLVLGGLGWLAVGNQTEELAEGGIAVVRAEAEAAREASGCEVLEVTQLANREHLDPSTAPPADALYTNGRPTASGPHYETPGPIFSGVRDEQLDERSVTHNLEHGSVIVWFDPEQVDDETVDDIDAWVELLNEAGFDDNNGRAGILASPFTDPGIDSGKAIAIRTWGDAMDCDSWDRDWANAWVIEEYGTRGDAPEAALGAYPTGVLEFVDEGETGDDADGDDADAEDADAEDADAEDADADDAESNPEDQAQS